MRLLAAIALASLCSLLVVAYLAYVLSLPSAWVFVAPRIPQPNDDYYDPQLFDTWTGFPQ